MAEPLYTCCEDGMLSQVQPTDRSGLCPKCHPARLARDEAQQIDDAHAVLQAAEEFDQLAEMMDSWGQNSGAESCRARSYQLRQVLHRLIPAIGVTVVGEAQPVAWLHVNAKAGEQGVRSLSFTPWTAEQRDYYNRHGYVGTEAPLFADGVPAAQPQQENKHG